MADFEFPGWRDGVNNVFREDRLTRYQLREAKNVDLLPGGHPRRRRGRTPIFQGGKFHSINSVGRFLVFVKDGELCTSEDLVNYSAVRSGIAGELAMEIINGELYYSDGIVTGVLGVDGSHRELGCPSPERQPIVIVDLDGGLYEGVYQVAVTFVSEAGVESGTPMAANIQVPEGGGVMLHEIPQPDFPAQAIRIYMSDANGDRLYLRTQIDPGTTQFLIGHKRPRKRLDTQFLEALPGSDFLAEYNGRLFAMKDNMLMFSEPLNFGMYQPVHNYVLLASKGRGVASVRDGIYFSDSDGAFFLQGSRPREFSISSVDHAPAQPGSMTTVDGGLFDAALAHIDVAAWWSSKGYMIAGLPGGEIRRIREAELAIPQYQQMAMAQVDREGVKQLVSVAKNPGMRSDTAFGDSASIEVHKKGISLKEE